MSNIHPKINLTDIHSRRILDRNRYDVILIGASTGAPGIIEHIIAGLPADMPLPIVIAQHMPPSFTSMFAQRLDEVSPLTAYHAEDGMPLFPGTLYVGPGRQHIRVRKTGRRLIAEINEEPAQLPYKPAVDELFASAAATCRGRALAIVMTGMGRDGTIGAEALHKAGGNIITQDAKSCAVYGMPKSVVEAGYSHHVMSPEAIRWSLLSLSPSFRGWP